MFVLKFTVKEGIPENAEAAFKGGFAPGHRSDRGDMLLI
jgi:hypothetical protein